jgi:GT2 family glycosyltransferase
MLVVDQTDEHARETAEYLRKRDEQGWIRWLRIAGPSIPGAMNRGLLEARSEIVLFLDDDIEPFPDLVTAHADAHGRGARLVAGRVLQPWDGDIPRAAWAEKKVASTEEREVDEFMGGNFSVRREDAIALGGFDENFVRVAYNFEREFADRWRERGGRIQFRPDAAIRHLKASSGGTRTFGEHLTTLRPSHSVGAYYYLLRSRLAKRRLAEFVARPFRAVATRHHLRHPWWIPVTLAAELAGMVWAVALHARGPRYCAAGLPERC